MPKPPTPPVPPVPPSALPAASQSADSRSSASDSSSPKSAASAGQSAVSTPAVLSGTVDRSSGQGTSPALQAHRGRDLAEILHEFSQQQKQMKEELQKIIAKAKEVQIEVEEIYIGQDDNKI